MKWVEIMGISWDFMLWKKYFYQILMALSQKLVILNSKEIINKLYQI